MMEGRIQLPARALRLRVLNGRLAGAEHRLPIERSVSVGHSFENDVVLRGEATAGVSAELHLSEHGVMLRVLTGSLGVLGRAAEAGEELLLPLYLPVTLGDYAFAVGADDAARWDEAAEIAGQMAAPPAPDALARPRVPMGQRLAARVAPWRRAGRRRWAVATGAIGALVLAGIAVPVVEEWQEARDRDPAHVRRQLAEAGFGSLAVAADPGGAGVLITGAVSTDREAERLQAYAAERFPGSLVEVDSASALAADATDVLRAQGVAAQAQPLAAGAIVVTGDYMPADKQAELTALLRRDLPALRRVTFRPLPGHGSDDLRHFFNSPTYGAASFVDGDPGFIVTGDGSRWFAGAVLPTGHRLVSVGRGRVTLERGGRTEVLTM